MQIDRYCSVNVSPENMYLEWLVVTPERQQTLEVLSPSVGHACIRLQIGLKAHASSRRRLSQQQTEEADRDTRCVSVWHLVRVPGRSCSIFWRAQQKTFTEEATTSGISINDRKTLERDAGRLFLAWPTHIQIEAQTPFPSLPQVVS